MAATLTSEATINQHLAYIKPKHRELKVDFLRTCIDSAYQWLRFDSEGAGSTKGAITCDQLDNFRVPLQPMEEQDKIATHALFLINQIDQLMSTTELSIGFLKERRTALISAAVTGRIDVRSAAS